MFRRWKEPLRTCRVSMLSTEDMPGTLPLTSSSFETLDEFFQVLQGYLGKKNVCK